MMSLMLMLVFSGVLMTGVLVRGLRPGAPGPRRASVGWRRGSRSLALALVLAMGSVTASVASAKSTETSTSQGATPVAAGAPTGATVARDRDYASREASARGLEKFKGGDTTIVLGSGLLVVVLIVVLLVVLL
jgi:hypothetical protein